MFGSDDKIQCAGVTTTGDRCKCGVPNEGDYCRRHEYQAPGADPDRSLTDQQRAFVELYCSNGFNHARAAEQTGYAHPVDKGGALLRKPPIRAAIEKRLEEHAMSAAETLARLTEWGRGTVDHFVDETGRVDLESDRAARHRHLIKEIKVDKHGRPNEIKLHDPVDSVKTLAKIHGMVTDRVQHSGTVEHVERPAYDYTILTDDELDQLLEITEKLEAHAAKSDQE